MIAAIIRTGESDRLVVALEEGAFKSVDVSVGRVGNEYAEILDGVMQGDTVVTSAQFLIDSESSKTSDFKRMEARASDNMNMDGMDHSGHSMPAHDMSSGSAPMHQDGMMMDHSAMDHSAMNGEGSR